MVGLPARCASCLVAAEMIAVRGWLWFALAFTLVFAFGSAKAETQAATRAGAWKYGTNSACTTAAGVGETYVSQHNGSSGGFTYYFTLTIANETTGELSGTYYSVNNSTQVQGSTVGWSGQALSCPYSCPSNQNWTLTGSVCTRPDCVSPEVRNPSTGVCGPPPVCVPPETLNANGVCSIVCPAAGSNAMIGGAQAWGIAGSSATCTNGISYSGCKITCSSGVSSGGKASCTGCTFTGALSTGSDAAADPTTGPEIKAPTKPEECLAKGMGYVTTSSGTTCVAQDQAVEPISTKTTETTTTKDGTGVTTGTEETTVECIGDKCTTTTTTKDGSGTTTGTTTSTGTGDKSGTDPNKDEQTDCEKHPETIGCSQYGTPVEDGPLTTNSVGMSSLSPSLSSAGSCPADINLPKGMKFSWEYPCMYASGIRPVVIALAWLSAGFLLFGMRLD